MKRVFPALLAMLVVTACQKEASFETPTSPTDGGPAASGSFTAKIDGVPWTADVIAQAAFTDAANGLPRLVSISGISRDKKIVGMTMADSGVHVYKLTNTSFSVGFVQDSNSVNVNVFSTNAGGADAPGGTVNVRSIDTVKKTISGTFSFIAIRPDDNARRVVTDGAFTNIPYTENESMPPASSTDTFQVKVDGTPFVSASISGVYVAVTNTIAVQGGNRQGTINVAVTFPSNITPGTYDLDLFGGTHVAVYNTGTGTLSSLSSGKLQIVEHNKSTKRVRGTFSFKGEDFSGALPPADLTEGYFAVTYQ